MVHFICTSNPTIHNEQDLFYQCIVDVHKRFKAGDFVSGKLHWLELFPHRVDLTQCVIDTFGNEFDYFISAMNNVLGTTNKSFCSDSKCPKPVILSKSSEITLGVDGQTGTPQNVIPCLFPLGCTTRLLRLAFANITLAAHYAKAQGPNLLVPSSKECH